MHNKKLKNKHVLILVLFLHSLVGFSQERTGLLYKISKEGWPDSYLFGTIHILPDSLFYYPKKLEKILFKTSTLVLEINQTELNANSMANALLRPSGNTFDLFNPLEKDSVIKWGCGETLLSKSEFENAFSRLKPFALIQVGAKDYFKGAVKSYELELIRSASEKKINIAGLETLEFQLELFDALPDTILREMIMQHVRSDFETTENYNFLSLYKNQKIDELYKESSKELKKMGIEDRFLKDRNKSWGTKMLSLMSDNSCFFAVGAGHLGGEEGLLNLLIKKGYALEKIDF